MLSFRYTAIDEQNRTVEGQLPAESEENLRWLLLERGLRPRSIAPAPPEAGILARLDPRNRLPARSIHIELTLRQIAVMLRSGLTLLASVETVIEQPPSGAARKVYESIRSRLEAGSSLGEALREHRCFPPSVVAMIEMGEESGNLDQVIEQSARSMETRRRNQSAVITALFYPSFTFFFAIAICVYMVLFVIPPMQRALEALGRPLPAMTRSLLDVADFITRWGVLIGGGVLLLAVTFFILRAYPPGRLRIDQAFLRLPLIGTILRTGSTALFSRSMGTLLGSGIALVEGLRIAGTLHGNRYFSAVVDGARRRVLEGGTLADSLARPHAYTPMMLKMVAVGESSGNLEEALGHVADFHDERLQALIKRLSAILEPMVVIIVGLLVGYVYIAFFVGLYGGV